ncbi:hypothetical protein [Marinobacter sp. R17]|uniref:hypothetical protein n=1 Tax=Marinobacter sp. R17 TaxID=2484250 RepID=UPI000F4D0A60|nr:hypothetical protein [Marinobacter sp. R17]
MSDKDDESGKLGHLLSALIGFAAFAAFGYELLKGMLGEEITFNSSKYGISAHGLPAVAMISSICIGGLVLFIAGVRGILR